MLTFILTLKLTFMAFSRSTLFFKWKPPSLHLQSIEREILRSDMYPSHRSIVTFKVNQRLFGINKVFQEVSVFPEVSFNEKFIGELCIDLGDDLQGFFKVSSKQFTFTFSITQEQRHGCSKFCPLWGA